MQRKGCTERMWGRSPPAWIGRGNQAEVYVRGIFRSCALSQDILRRTAVDVSAASANILAGGACLWIGLHVGQGTPGPRSHFRVRRRMASCGAVLRVKPRAGSGPWGVGEVAKEKALKFHRCSLRNTDLTACLFPKQDLR